MNPEQVSFEQFQRTTTPSTETVVIWQLPKQFGLAGTMCAGTQTIPLGFCWACTVATVIAITAEHRSKDDVNL